MREEHRRVQRRQYLRLGTGELAAAAVFLAAAWTVVLPRLTGSEQTAFWFALLPLVVVLVQGGVYWLLARRWVLRGPVPAGLAMAYRWFRLLGPLLLIAGAVGVLIWWPARPAVGALVVVVLLFGVAEYLNYFVVRLAYPVRRWVAEVAAWRTPRLVRDVRRSLGRVR